MTISTTSTPHDAVFKSFLRHPDTARDFIDIHLPAPLRKLCDLTTLKLEPNSFIDEDLRQYYSDLLWSVKTQEGVGYIYVVIEHQSKPEELMAFRMMRYSIAAMQNHLDAGYKELPLVLPMLFYHGCRSPYPYSLCWLDEFAEPAIARKIYSSAFPLVDITVVPTMSRFINSCPVRLAGRLCRISAGVASQGARPAPSAKASSFVMHFEIFHFVLTLHCFGVIIT